MRETRTMLKNRAQSLPDISKESGIPFYWLRKFLWNEIRDPGVNRVQLLWEYLAKRKLDVDGKRFA